VSDTGIYVIDLSMPEAMPGFRVTADFLSGVDALLAVRTAAVNVQRAALAARLSLLRVGFASGHSACKELDRTAAQYEVVQQVVARQLTHLEESRP
jgi:hypothetical protein